MAKVNANFKIEETADHSGKVLDIDEFYNFSHKDMKTEHKKLDKS